MTISFNRTLLVLASLLWTHAFAANFFSNTASPANFIFQASLTDVNSEKYNYKDSTNKIHQNAVWSQYTYLRPSIGTDVMILDPDNPANIILYVRTDPADTLSLPGGFIVDMIEPFENALELLNKKIKVKDSEGVIPLGMGTAGIPRMEDMFLLNTPRVGPVLGMVGFKDRAPGQHVINICYHMVTEPGMFGKLVPNHEKVARVVSIKMIHLLVKGIDQLMPGELKNGHFLNNVAIPGDGELGDAKLPLHHDHLRLIFRLFMRLVNRGLLSQNGELTDNYEELKYLYQILEEDDEEDLVELESDKKNLKFV